MAHIQVEAQQVKSDHGDAYLNFIGRNFHHGIAAWRIIDNANLTYIITDSVRGTLEILILDKGMRIEDALESLKLSSGSKAYFVTATGLVEVQFAPESDGMESRT